MSAEGIRELLSYVVGAVGAFVGFTTLIIVFLVIMKVIEYVMERINERIEHNH